MVRFVASLALTGCFLAMLACSSLQPTPVEPSKAVFESISISPEAGSEVTWATIVTAEVHYRIDNFDATSRDYFLAFVFNSNKCEECSFNANPRFDDEYKVVSSVGVATIQYPLENLRGDSRLRTPVTAWVVLVQKTGVHSATTIAISDPIKYR
jgi:hypothetical protein